jgi:hypothetical protein
MSLPGLIALGLLAGCGAGSLKQIATLPALQGMVRGGQQPVVGANVVLYAAGSGGYGSTNTTQLSSTVTSGAGGSFSITGLYTCPSASAQMYLVATGGDSGAGFNSSLALMAALGSCGNLSSSTFANIDEVTTVAAVYALAPFMATNGGAPGASIGTSGTNSQGLTQAFATANNLVNTASGLPSGASLPAGATIPSAELFTLADILATCVNSDGSTGECSTLFADATPSGGSAPANTIDAIFDIAQNPDNNVSALYNLVSGTSPFQPVLGSTSNDWTLAINYSGSALDGPTSLAVDGAGDIWVVNTSGNSLSEFTNNGSVLSGSLGYTGGGLSGPASLAIDPSTNVWVTNPPANSLSQFSSSGTPASGSGYTGGGLASPQGIALVIGGTRALIANAGGNDMSVFDLGGASESVSGYTGGGLNSPRGAALSPANRVYMTNYGGNSLSEFQPSGHAFSPAGGYTGGGLNQPLGIAIDGASNLWVANNGASSLSEFNSSGAAITGTSGYTGGGLANPSQLAIDGLGNIWVTNPGSNRVSEFKSNGTAISGSAGYTAGGLDAPQGIAIDGSGSIWVANQNSSILSEIVGAAAPVVTPIDTATRTSKLGQRP